MKQLFYTFVWYILSLQLTFADGWILWNFAWDSASTDKALKTWDIHTEDIPIIFKWAIDFMLSIAWTISIIMIIFWAYKILLWSLEQDKSKWKDTIMMALMWFAIASLAWFIIKFIIDNLS
jgi:hypothetical protein